MRKARSDYVNNIIESAFQEADTKPFWKFIRPKPGGNIGVAPLKSQGKLFADGWSKAEILNNQYKSVFTEKSSDIPTSCGPNFPPIGNIQVNINGVQKLLSNIKANNATWPDNIPCRILKEAAPELAQILTDIFQHSLRDGVLPDNWKKVQVSPVFKKGNTNNAENYRPILLTCVSCKLLEHIISHHIHEHLDRQHMASDTAIPVSPNSLSQHKTWASPTMRRYKCTSQSLISPRPLIKSRTNDSRRNWGTTGSRDKPADGFKSSSAIVCFTKEVKACWSSLSEEVVRFLCSNPIMLLDLETRCCMCLLHMRSLLRTLYHPKSDYSQTIVCYTAPSPA